MQAVDADIWVLTETRDDAIPTMNFSSASTSSRPGCRDGRERWTTVWSRYPMLEIHFTSQPARAVCVEIDTEPRKTLVYGTVLPWHSDPGEGSARGWEEFDRVVELQGADWLRLRRKYPDHLLCVAGDFNQVLDGASPAGYGSTSGRQHLRRLMEDSNLRCLTDEWFVKTEKLAARRNIDHICASSGNVRAVHAWEGFEHHDGKIVELSDHNGVMIDLEV